ncbi:hypothetical protein CALVIDRAFT_542078 [Calocera viscosa TUFC12733]|uniref:Uncharacterized protein n=1 Tax=Calocera viscosa (strain TUFC12733) TaxID=1330018 RepID=A0A167H0P4_CALVF|nr:hypothetical protein CALVIDRAFT_542078 [Calocera viscosa TUFC12733]
MPHALPLELIEQVERVLNARKESVDGQVNGHDEPLTDFHLVNTLNSLFPDESSLGRIEQVQAGLKSQHAALQEEIAELRARLRQESDASRMQTIQALIAELLSQMTRIREKATESEAIVRELTKDIQALDLAKRNLSLSLTVMKRFQILVNDLGRLDGMVQERKYSEVAPTLAAVKQIATSFKPYTSVDKIALGMKRMQELIGQLRAELDEDFEAFYSQDRQKQVKASTIRSACEVVDVMGDDVRLQLIDRYCALELKEYRRIFRSTDEAGQLDNISRRFAWFKRVLNVHDEERAGVFPKEWKVEQYLCAKFTDITRDDLAVALTRAGQKLTVTLLLESLKETLEFEQSMAKKFEVPFLDVVKVAASITKPPAMLSSVFDNHMGVFVDAQDKALSDMLASYRGTKSRASLDEATSDGNNVTVLPSSTDLFYFYRQILEQCAKLSNKQALFDLCALQKKWLRIYAEDVLVAGLKPDKERFSLDRKSMEGKVNVPELRNACLVLNTAEYCHATAAQLEERITELIHADYKEKVSLQPEQDVFVGVIASAISVLLKELDSATDASFAVLVRSGWGDVTSVSGPSNAISEVVRNVEAAVDVLREQVQYKKWLRNFYDKAANTLMTKFKNAMVKSRPIKEVSAEQIMIDLQALRTCLLDFPGTQSGDAMTSYSRNITKTASSLETVLKLVIAPVVPGDSFVQNYTLLIQDTSFSNFQKILDLKGTPRAEQNTLLDTFLTVTSTMEHLESASFLSSLDMDPDNKQSQPSALGRTLTSPPIGGSGRVTLPSILVGSGALTDEPGTGLGISTSAGRGEQPRQVFSNFRSFMAFGARRESVAK